tara:strand:- start:109 stop:951 length:843 start_codon:yes stop_codon:yes gene_type:complete
MQVMEMVRKEALRRGYSLETIKTYNSCLEKFFRIYRKDPKSITKKDVENYVDQMVKWNRASSTINVHVSALQFFFSKVLKKKLMVDIPYSKRRKRFPEYLIKEDLVRLLNVIDNKKHKLIVALLYASGMRLSELLNLRVKEIDFINNQGWVRGGKGNKDRPFILAHSLKQDLQSWIKENNLENDSLLFTGRKGKLNSSTVREILKKASKKANLKHVHPHMMRHSFATHLALAGHSASEIQSLLGHSNIETTITYTHMARIQMLNIKSPYDSLSTNEKENA